MVDTASVDGCVIPAASLSIAFENGLPVAAFLRWLLFAAVLLALSYRRRHNVLIVLACGVFYAVQSLPALGDAAFLQGIFDKGERSIWTSEPLTHLLLTQTISPQTLRLFLPPIMGALSMWLWLRLPVKSQHRSASAPPQAASDESTPSGDQGASHVGSSTERVLLFASAPLQMVFYRGYLETMMIAVPAGLLFLQTLFMAADRPTRRSVVWASLALGLAVLVHGVFFFWLPVLPLLLVRGLRWRKAILYSLLHGLLVVLLYGLGLGLIALAGYELDWMNATGGGDGQSFVPLDAQADNPFVAYTFGSVGHVVAVVSIVVYAAPVLPLLLLRLRRLSLAGTDLALLLLVAAFVSFITLWNFDLGFFWDFDLIFSLSLPTALLTERLLGRGLRSISAIAVLQTVLWMLAYSRFF